METGKTHDRPAETSALSREPSADHGTRLDVAALQEVQDALAAALGVPMVLRPPTGGAPLTRSSLPHPFFAALEPAAADVPALLAKAGLPERTAVVAADGRPVAVWAFTERLPAPPERALLDRLSGASGVAVGELSAAAAGVPVFPPEQRSAGAAAVAAVAALAGRAYWRRMEIRRRERHLKTLVAVGDLVAAGRNLTSVLNAIARAVTETMGAKAAMIRLLDDAGEELVARAVHKLSWRYVAKGPVRLSESAHDRAALAGEIVVLDDLQTDPRTLYPDDMAEEGVVGGLVAGMIHAGQPIGVIRIYTDTPRRWTADEKELLHAVADQAAVAIVNSRLLEDARHKERMDREIELGRQVQRRMLPARPPQVPGFGVGNVYEPARMIAGDFYDFIPLGDGRLGVAVGDVMGKGIPAALWMASVRATLRANLEHEDDDIARVLSRVNRALCRDAVNGQFATLFFGVLDPSARTLAYVNAGHEAPVLLRDGREESLAGSSPLLGVIPDAAFEAAEVRFRPGDVLTVWTDGAGDAMNFFDEPFGRDRILKAVRARAGEPAQAIADQIHWDIRRFAGLNARRDDITIVVLKADE